MTSADSVETGVKPGLLQTTADIVSVYVRHNQVAADGLPNFIKNVHATVGALILGKDDGLFSGKLHTSAAKSITPDYLICLDDGRKFKSLKRHLASLGMTPDQYRTKWNLAADYPMVASNYAATRSALAKKIGLGQNRKRG